MAYYTVQRGDSWWQIGQRAGAANPDSWWQVILAANQFHNNWKRPGTLLHPGDVIWVPDGTRLPTTPGNPPGLTPGKPPTPPKPPVAPKPPAPTIPKSYQEMWDKLTALVYGGATPANDLQKGLLAKWNDPKATITLADIEAAFNWDLDKIAMTPEDREFLQTFTNLQAQFKEMGLDGLLTFIPGTSMPDPSSWLIRQYMAGVRDSESLWLALQETEMFKARFPWIAQARIDAAAGKDVYVPTAAEVLEYEKGVRDLFTRARMPLTFFDTSEEIQALGAKGLSVAELQSRIGDAFVRVENAPAEVIEAYREWYTGDPRAALASFFLDPEKSEAAVLREVEAAFVGGYAAQAGLDDLSKKAAEEAAGSAQAGMLSSALSEVTAAPVLSDGTVSRGGLDDDTRLLGTMGVDAAFTEEVNRYKANLVGEAAGAGEAMLGRERTGLSTSSDS